LISIFSSTSLGYAQSEDPPVFYLIQPGDTLGSIANNFDTTVEDLMIANNISDPNFISPGDKLVIPSLFGISGIITPVTLNIGESLDQVSSFNNIDSSILISLNKITSMASIAAGSTIFIPLKDNGDRTSQTVSYFPTPLSLLEFTVKIDSNVEKVVTDNSFTSYVQAIGDQYIYLDQANARAHSTSPSIENLRITLTPLPLAQGATASLKITSPIPISISGSMNDTALHFYTENNMEFFALQGIHAMEEPGISTLNLSIIAEEGTLHSFEQSILIQPGNFSTDPPLVVDPETIKPENTAAEEKLVNDLTSKFTEEKYWSGLFQSPAFYQDYTSLFGSRRTYNDDPNISFHSGLDFGGGVTLPIVAPADGKVVFSGLLPIRGNTVFIDHGLGIFTGYFHQSILLVSEGDFVTTGQKIGEVGNTGRVSNATDYPGAGAHLHWEVWVNGVQADPLDWLTQEYP
jgi:murein DD-endopeptidase MepM/ murein hydrolase activator NlpD